MHDHRNQKISPSTMPSSDAKSKVKITLEIICHKWPRDVTKEETAQKQSTMAASFLCATPRVHAERRHNLRRQD
uniref:Uncharacterized protein n=1 Tax=Steinernema glaseri TaxID=37863 RepID=A0A1I8ACI5_9BILA